jgi:hypothetical protein
LFSQPAVQWTIAPILSEFPKDFLFHAGGAMPKRRSSASTHAMRMSRDLKHGYEGVANLPQAFINSRAFVRVISSILA